MEEFQIASELFKAHANQLFDFMAEKLSDCIGRFGNRSARVCAQACCAARMYAATRSGGQMEASDGLGWVVQAGVCCRFCGWGGQDTQ